MLRQLKQADANLTSAYVRTDNAGCYKGSDTLLAVKQIYQDTGVLVRRIDFADAQSGKGPCDRMASVTKANVWRFVNERNDCVTSSQFVHAAKSTRFMTVMACRLPEHSSQSKTRWPGVQNFNNIQYDWTSDKADGRSRATGMEIKVTVWRAFELGSGQSFHWSKLSTPTVAITPIQIAARHDNASWQADSLVKGKFLHCKPLPLTTRFILLRSGRVEDEDEDRDVDEDANDNTLIDDDAMDVGSTHVVPVSPAFVTFDCPENHCTMQFRREDRLNAHLLLDLHKILVPSFRLLDKAIIMYKAGLESDNHKHVPRMAVNNSDESVTTAADDRLAEGWALFRARPRVPFTIHQRSYLEEKYNEGEKSGAKWDAASVAEVSHSSMWMLFL